MSDLFDDSLLDMFGHMAISKNPDPGTKMKSPEPRLRVSRKSKRNNCSKIKEEPVEIQDDQSRPDSSIAPDQAEQKETDQMSDDQQQVPDKVSLIKSLTDYAVMSTVGLASAAIVVYALNFPCI